MKKLSFFLAQMDGGKLLPSFYSDEIELSKEFTPSEILGGIVQDAKEYLRLHKRFNCKLINCSLPCVVVVKVDDKLIFDSLTIQRKRKMKFALKIGYSYTAINKFGSMLKAILEYGAKEFSFLSLDEVLTNNAIEAIEEGKLLPSYN